MNDYLDDLYCQFLTNFGLFFKTIILTKFAHSLIKNPLKSLITLIWCGLLCFSVFFMVKNEIRLFDLVDLLKIYFSQFRYNGLGLWVPLLFVVVFALRPLFFIPTWIMNILAYFLFGPFLGYFWVVISEVVSAASLFLIVKYLVAENLKNGILKTAKKCGIDLNSSQNTLLNYSQAIETKLAKTAHSHWPKSLKKIASSTKKFFMTNKNLSKNKDFYTALVLRLASLPFDLVTGLCAVTGISFKKFILATFSVSLVWVGLFFLTFDSLVSGSSLNSTINIVIFLLLMVFSLLLAKKSGLISFNKNTQKYV